MGMYTELVFRADFDSKVMSHSDEAAVRCLFGEGAPEDTPLPAHPLFSARRWDALFHCSSAYHAGACARALQEWPYLLSVAGACSLKDYCDEIDLFLDWAAPLLSLSHLVGSSMLLGWMRYEEDDDWTLLWLTADRHIKKSTARKEAE